MLKIICYRTYLRNSCYLCSGYQKKVEKTMLTEAFLHSLLLFHGEFISYFIDGFIPGSVIGMVLLFLALAFKKVKPEKVKRLSTVLTQNMGLFFVPAGVGLMNSFGIISRVLGSPADRFRSKYNFSHRQRSVGATKNWKRENRPWIIWRIPRFSLLPW